MANYTDSEADDELYRQAFGDYSGISIHCLRSIRRIKNNLSNYNYDDTKLLLDGFDAERFTNQAWRLLGRYIANNNHLYELDLDGCNLTDEKMALLFTELVKSSSLKTFHINDNSFGINGVWSMIPFLQNSNLSTLLSSNNNFNSECFEVLVSALNGTFMRKLYFYNCNITNISALDRYNLPNLESLNLNENHIGREGIITISNLLQQEGSNLKTLYLRDTGLGDQEAKIIANSLKHNTKLETLYLGDNKKITEEGYKTFLKLLVDISSIDNTYDSNHTLTECKLIDNYDENEDEHKIHAKIAKACSVNITRTNPGRSKVITYQLKRQNRKKLCGLQGIEYSPDNIFADIEPALLPKILALIGERHGQSELYTALIPAAPDLLSYIDRKALINKEMESVEARGVALKDEYAAFIANHKRKMANLNDKKADLSSRLALIDSGGMKRSAVGEGKGNGVVDNGKKKRQRS